jgi:hypothetical protein
MDAKIWSGMLVGKTQLQIAGEIGISQVAVSVRFNKLLKKRQELNLGQVEQYRNNELLRLNYLEAEAWRVSDTAWRAWRKSGGLVKIVKKIAKSGSPKPGIPEAHPGCPESGA